MNITLKDLLDAGVHFGHQTKRWNPKSKKYIFDHRQGVSIIDLEKTYANLEKACTYLEDTVAAGKQVLFIGTKRQAQEVLREAAVECRQQRTRRRGCQRVGDAGAASHGLSMHRGGPGTGASQV